MCSIREFAPRQRGPYVGFRVGLSAQLSFELIKDFTVGLTLTESYDSAPPTEGADTNDTSVVFSIGWTF